MLRSSHDNPQSHADRQVGAKASRTGSRPIGVGFRWRAPRLERDDRAPASTDRALPRYYRCAETIRFACEQGVPMTVRAGGHSVAGKSVMDGAVMLDLSLMRHVAVDPVRRRAVAQAGATWRDFDTRTHAHGLATTGGAISTTGIACGPQKIRSAASSQSRNVG